MSKYYQKYNIAWPKQDIVQFALQANFKQAQDQAGILWPCDESMLGVKADRPLNQWSEALIDFTQSEIGRMYFSKVHWGGLPIHRDHKRQCALNFPVVGDFDNSMNIFVDDHDQLLEKFNGEEPALINTRQFHGVTNKTDKDRIILSVSFHESFEIIKQRGFRNNEVFYVQ